MASPSIKDMSEDDDNLLTESTNSNEVLTVHPNIHISDLVSIRLSPLSSTSGARKFFRGDSEVTGPPIGCAKITIAQFVKIENKYRIHTIRKVV